MILNYIKQINLNKFKLVSEKIFRVIQYEGLDEEFNRFKKSDWLYFKLELEKKDINGLKNFDDDIINKFNEFDILLKNKFNMKYIDLIDYENGFVYIVTTNINSITEEIYFESNVTRDFTLDFHNQSVKKDIMITTFKIVIETGNGAVEKYCQETWSHLVTHKLYSIDELKELQVMKRYIKNNISSNDISYVHKYFYDKGYFDNINISNKFTSIEITNYDCKMWVEKPHIELEGTISLDLKKVFDFYMKKGYFTLIMPYKQKLINIQFDITFSKSFPLYATYRNNELVKKISLSYVKDELNKKNTRKLLKDIENSLKISNIHEYKKEIVWKTNKINVNINDTTKLLKLKAKNNILPMAGGYILYKKLRGK